MNRFSNYIYVTNASQQLYFWCQDNLVITNPDYVTMIRIGKENLVKLKHIPEKIKLYGENGLDLIIPFGCLNAIWPLIKDKEYELVFNQNEPLSHLNEQITQPLYDYQEKAVSAMVKAKGGVLQGGCGSGKTNCGIEIIHRLGKRALWICGKTDLLNQTVARMNKLYPHMKVGTITDGKIKMNEVTVSTIQTLSKIDLNYYKQFFDLVIVDECQHCVNDVNHQRMFAKVVNSIPARYKFGLTATPKRIDGLHKSMFAMLGCNLKGEFEPTYIIDKSETKTLIAEHIKVACETPFYINAEDENGNIKKVSPMLNPDGTFNNAALVDYIATNEQRNNKIIENVVSLNKEGRKQLILCSRVEQCKMLNERLQQEGVKSVLLLGKITDKKRKDIFEHKVEWNTIVATVSLAKEGLDIVELDTLHLVSCIANKNDTIQAAGRIERICEGKKEPKVFDYVDIHIPYLNSKWKKRVVWLKGRK